MLPTQTARFDLKGIRDRRTKPGGAVAEETGSPVLWDAEWLDSELYTASAPPCHG